MAPVTRVIDRDCSLYTIEDMMVRKQSVPLPLTAAQKFAEAAYFYNSMIRNSGNTRSVPFFFSAYLAALKSAIDFLQKQNNSHPRFKAWFDEQMTRIGDDPIMSQFHELRNTTIHRKPIDKLSFSSGPRFDTEYVETNHFEADNWTDDEGNDCWKYRLGPDAPWLQHGTIIEWFLETPEKEYGLFAVCNFGLAYVDRLISDWVGVESIPS